MFYCDCSDHSHTHATKYISIMPAKGVDGYHPSKSKITTDTLSVFIAASLTGDLKEVPGLKDAGVKALTSGEGSDKVYLLLLAHVSVVWHFAQCHKPDQCFGCVSCKQSLSSCSVLNSLYCRPTATDHQHTPADWQVPAAERH